MSQREELVARLKIWVEDTEELLRVVKGLLPLIQRDARREAISAFRALPAVRGPLGTVNEAIQNEFNRRFCVAQEVERDSAEREDRAPDFVGVRERVLLEMGLRSTGDLT